MAENAGFPLLPTEYDAATDPLALDWAQLYADECEDAEAWADLAVRALTVRDAARDEPRAVVAGFTAGRARWRQALVILGHNDVWTAAVLGRKALALLQSAHDDVARVLPEAKTGAMSKTEADRLATIWDETLAQELIARTDLAEMLGAISGETSERIGVLMAGRERGHAGTPGPRSWRALGCVHHNLSVAEVVRLRERAARGGDVDPMVPTLSASRALEIRLQQLSADNPITVTEAANTQMQYAICLILAQDASRAAALIKQHEPLLALIPGPHRARAAEQRENVIEMFRFAFPRHRGRL
ncbi:hypothetical protein ACFTWD_38115 [Streptomyces sp. NPDC056943]|uniref:hypothetical protein n=1 Tax=Streptomyces sp. NPDC056943 TaxID=3345971 RepID=UPI00363F66D9